jgi:methionyl-tRNA formyltransferase
MKTYLVAGTRPWNRRVFDEVISRFPGSWSFVDGRAPLTPESVAAIRPRYIFFLHWSARVPREIVTGHECVCFHMTDVPYGRGGSPLQNLIARGHRETRLSALRMVEELDAGPVYLKEPLSLEGGAEEIYIRATELSARMIRRIIDEEPAPVPQRGEPTVFRRRQPEESRIPALESLGALFDFIRMLDAREYPAAFLDHQGFRYELRRAALRDGEVEAEVRIRRIGETPAGEEAR